MAKKNYKIKTRTETTKIKLALQASKETGVPEQIVIRALKSPVRSTNLAESRAVQVANKADEVAITNFKCILEKAVETVIRENRIAEPVRLAVNIAVLSLYTIELEKDVAIEANQKTALMLARTSLKTTEKLKKIAIKFSKEIYQKNIPKKIVKIIPEVVAMSKRSTQRTISEAIHNKD